MAEMKVHSAYFFLIAHPFKTLQCRLKFIFGACYVSKIEFHLPAESACDFSAATKMGDVDTELPLEIVEDGFGFLRGKLNGGGADVKLVTHMGQIVIGNKSMSLS